MYIILYYIIQIKNVIIYVLFIFYISILKKYIFLIRPLVSECRLCLECARACTYIINEKNLLWAIILIRYTVNQSYRLSVFFMLHRWCYYISNLCGKEIQIRGFFLADFLTEFAYLSNGFLLRPFLFVHEIAYMYTYHIIYYLSIS